MNKSGKRALIAGSCRLLVFVVWTMLVQSYDVQAAGETGTELGFSALNLRFHALTGVHWSLYILTDWLGLVPVLVCLIFAGLGLCQWLRRKSLRKVDFDLLLLGAYYALVVGAYLLFEMHPVNERPVLIDGAAEASYPSSTTLLVLSVMPTLVFQLGRRMKAGTFRRSIGFLTILFSLFMALGRLISGVHWLTDIVGAVLLSAGLFGLYRAAVLLYCGEKR